MEVTFLDLKEKFLTLEKKKWQLRDKLQHKASELVNELVYSLGLDSNTWIDSQGKHHAYVGVGVWKSTNEFENVPFPRLQMDEKYNLNFVLVITLDDNALTGGARHGVSVSLWYVGSILHVTIGAGDDIQNFQVSDIGGVGAFAEVCSGIKAIILLSIERSQPNYIP
ncbi:hypothetical protein ACI6PW_23360 [Serratia marcescens]|uniref:hypothetical protein n=1 Tax=Serratia marcescens TaxID=615 RepID=UPI003ED885D6